MPERLSNGGWIAPDHGQTAADLYARWLHDRGYEDSPERRAEFAAAAGGEFEAAYAARSGVTVEFLHEHGRRAVLCTCDEDDCEGWAMGHDVR